jgi:mitochondrial distribution and morphology protein 31
MATSGTSTQLGRKLWAAFRDSASILGVGRNAHPIPLPRPGVPPSPWTIYHGQTVRWFSRQSQVRASPKNVRHCTSGGLLLLAVSSSPSSAGSVVTTCTAVADSAFSGSALQKSKISHLARQISAFHQLDRGGSRVVGKRSKSSKAKGQDNEGLRTPPAQPKPASQPGDAHRSATNQPTEPPIP